MAWPGARAAQPEGSHLIGGRYRPHPTALSKTPALARRAGDAPTRSGEVALRAAPRLRSWQIRRSDADRGGRQSPWTTRLPRRLPWPDRAPRPLAARATRARLAEGSRPRGPAPNRTPPPRELPSAPARRSVGRRPRLRWYACLRSGAAPPVLAEGPGAGRLPSRPTVSRPVGSRRARYARVARAENESHGAPRHPTLAPRRDGPEPRPPPRTPCPPPPAAPSASESSSRALERSRLWVPLGTRRPAT